MAEADDYQPMYGPKGRWKQLRQERDAAMAEAERLRTLLTDPDAFWEAVYPHIDEYGPDLNGSDCEAICRWLTAALASGVRHER